MERDPELFLSGEVTIEASIEHCRFSWPVSIHELNEACSGDVNLDDLEEEYAYYLETTNLVWDRAVVSADASWEGVTFSASASVDIPMANEKDEEDEDDVFDMVPDMVVMALEGNPDALGFNHYGLEDVSPTVTADWTGEVLRVTVEVPPTLRAWNEPLPSLEEAISSECDFSSVPESIRKLLGVSGDRMAWDSVDITDESDESGIGYSATATLQLSLNGALDEEDEDTLRSALDDNYGSLLAELPGAEYECDDGGSVSVEVEQEFEEPETEEEEDEEEDWDGEIDEEDEDDLEDDLEDDQEDKKDED